MKTWVSLSLAALSAASFAQVAIPFTDTFETHPVGPLSGAANWLNDGPGFTIANQAFAGTQGMTWSNAAAGTSWAFVDFSFNVGGSADKLVTTSVMVNADGSALTGTAWAGIDSYEFAGGFFRICLVTPFFSGDPEDKGSFIFTDWNGATDDVFQFQLQTDNFSGWNKLDLVQNFANNTYTFKWNGEAMPWVGNMRPRTVLSDNDLRAGKTSGADAFSAHFDDYSVSKTTPKTITGTVTLESIADQSDFVIFGELYSGSTQVDSLVAVSDMAGAVSFTTGAPDGVYDLYLQGAFCLQKKVTAVISGGVANFGSTSLKNGDSVSDNVVDLSDYTVIATAFNGLLDTDVDTPGNQPSANWDFRADLDFSGVVDLTDYTIVATNFNSLGDNTP
jgi:hypothetical protein